MAFSFKDSIVPMSELRVNPDKIKEQLKSSPVIITNKGKPDFAVCDLETAEIASRIFSIRKTIRERMKDGSKFIDVEKAFARLDKKYGF